MGYYAKRLFNQKGGIDDYTVAYNFNGNANDLSSNGLNLTLSNGANLINDRLNILSDDISRAVVSDPMDITSFEDKAFSISVRFNITAFRSYNFIVLKGINNQWQLDFFNGRLEFYIIGSTAPLSYLKAMSVMRFNINQTYDLLITYSGGVGNNFKIYVDSSLISHTYTILNNYVKIRNLGLPLTLGYYNGYYGLNGWMDNFRIYKRELTQLESIELANLQ